MMHELSNKNWCSTNSRATSVCPSARFTHWLCKFRLLANFLKSTFFSPNWANHAATRKVKVCAMVRGHFSAVPCPLSQHKSRDLTLTSVTRGLFSLLSKTVFIYPSRSMDRNRRKKGQETSPMCTHGRELISHASYCKIPLYSNVDRIPLT